MKEATLGELMEAMSDILAKAFERSDGDYAEISTTEIFGENTDILKDKKLTDLLADTLKDKHSLILALEYNQKTLFIMSKDFLDNIEKNSLQYKRKDFERLIAQYGGYEAYVKHTRNKPTDIAH